MDTPDAPLTPVNPPDTPSQFSKRPLDWIVGLSSLSLVLIALVVAVIVFAGFVETDRDTIQLLSAAALSFGTAAFAILPFGCVAWWALRAQTHPVLVSLFVVPWIGVGGLWIAAGRFDILPGLLVIVVSALALIREFSALKLNRG